MVEVTEVRIKLMPSQNDKLRAFCSITLDNNFVIRDLKVIEGGKGPFLAMPSRKLMERCRRCSGKNHHRANYCNDCGLKLSGERGPPDPESRFKLHVDIAHPINARCREAIQSIVLARYLEELEKAKSPDYHPEALDDFEVDLADDPFEAAARDPVDRSRPDGAVRSPRRAAAGPRNVAERSGPPVPPWAAPSTRGPEPADSFPSRVALRGSNGPQSASLLRGATRMPDGSRPLLSPGGGGNTGGHPVREEPEDNFGAGLFS